VQPLGPDPKAGLSPPALPEGPSGCLTGAPATRGIGAAPEPVGTSLADPGDRRWNQLDAEQVGHQLGQPLFGHELIMQQADDESPQPILDRRPSGKLARESWPAFPGHSARSDSNARAAP
jgi:hypothetical protein